MPARRYFKLYSADPEDKRAVEARIEATKNALLRLGEAETDYAINFRIDGAVKAIELLRAQTAKHQHLEVA